MGYVFAVPIPVIASFRKMKKLTRDYVVIVAALKESSLLVIFFISHSNALVLMKSNMLNNIRGILFLQVVSSDGKKIKRLHPLPQIEVRDPKVLPLGDLEINVIFNYIYRFLAI